MVALIQRYAGRRHHAHARKCDIELLGDNLRQRGEDALADLDLARGNLDEALGAKAQPLREAPVDAQASGQGRTGGHALAGRLDRDVHFVSIAAAARSTARTMRW